MIELKPKYQSKYYLNKLDELIDDSVKLFENRTSRVLNQNIGKLAIRESIILEHLSQKTNFKGEFLNMKASYGNLKIHQITIGYNILAELGKSRKQNNFSNFLFLLNKYAAEIRKKPLKNFTYYIPIRLKLNLTDSQVKKLRAYCRKACDVDITIPPKYIYNQIESQKFKAYLNNRKIMFKVIVKARDMIFALTIAEKNVDFLLGSIVFAKNIYRTRRKWSMRGVNYSLSEHIIDEYFIIVSGKQLIYPTRTHWLHFQSNLTPNDITVIGKNKWDINAGQGKDYDRVLSVLRQLSKQNKGIKKISKKVLITYLQASVDINLELSFLKFWIISETIIKQEGRKTGL